MTTPYDLTLIRAQLAALRSRLQAAGELVDIRFVDVPKPIADAYLARVYQPKEFGWTSAEIDRLDELLGGRLPADYRLYLEYLGHWHSHLFDSYEVPRTPEAYLGLQQRIHRLFTEPDEDWVSTYPQGVRPPPTDALHVCFHGGYALTYLVPQANDHTLVQDWVEGETFELLDGQVDFHNEARTLLDELETMTHALERSARERMAGRGKFGCLGPGTTIRTVHPSAESPFRPLELPHREYHIEATPELRAYLGLD